MSAPVPPWQQRARQKAAKQPLNTDSIVATALTLLDRDGPDAVSMRRVAQELGTGAASLYAYVRNKSELHELMLDVVIGEMTLPEADPEHWREQLKEIAREQIRVLSAHPGIAQVVLRTPAPTGPNALVVVELTLTLLRMGGLPDRVAAFASDLFALYPTAVALEQTTSLGLSEAELGERMDQVQKYFAALPPDRFPSIVALQHVLWEGEGDARFEFGLDLLIRGLGTLADETAP